MRARIWLADTVLIRDNNYDIRGLVSCIDDLQHTKITSVKATAKPSLLLSRGLARPLTSRRIEYDTSGAFGPSRPSFEPRLSAPASSSLDDSGEKGVNLDWNCSSAPISFTDASILSGFELEERCQNSGNVVDMSWSRLA